MKGIQSLHLMHLINFTLISADKQITCCRLTLQDKIKNLNGNAKNWYNVAVYTFMYSLAIWRNGI